MSRMVLGIIAYIWMAVGAAFFWYFDRLEMKKEIPYGNMPSIFSLNRWRMICMLVALVIACPFFAWTCVLWIRANIDRCFYAVRIWHLKRYVRPPTAD